MMYRQRPRRTKVTGMPWSDETSQTVDCAAASVGTWSHRCIAAVNHDRATVRPSSLHHGTVRGHPIGGTRTDSHSAVSPTRSPPTSAGSHDTSAVGRRRSVAISDRRGTAHAALRGPGSQGRPWCRWDRDGPRSDRSTGFQRLRLEPSDRTASDGTSYRASCRTRSGMFAVNDGWKRCVQTKLSTQTGWLQTLVAGLGGPGPAARTPGPNAWPGSPGPRRRHR